MSSLMRPTVNQHRYGLIICGDGRPSASGNFAGQGPKKDGAPVPGSPGLQAISFNTSCETEIALTFMQAPGQVAGGNSKGPQTESRGAKGRQIAGLHRRGGRWPSSEQSHG